MSHRLQRRPSRPPPLFVAELDAAPAHGSVAAPSRTRDEPDRRMARTAEVGVGVQANPWPYHGPGFGDDENGPSATVHPTVQHQGPGAGGLSTNGLLDGDGLKLDVKPCCPPPERHDVSAGGLSSPASAGPKSVYRPYRPPSVPSPAGTPGTLSPSRLGAAPHRHSYRPFHPDSQPGSPAPVKATGEQEHAASPALAPVSQIPPSPSPSPSPTCTPSPHSSPQPNYPGPHAQYANSSAAYPFPNDSRPDSQPETTPAGHQHQNPPCSPPPPASPYPAQPAHATNTTPPNPPFPPGKPPPPLPPRRPQAQYHGGFGRGPVDAAAYPRPPKTRHNPMPAAYPPRPGSSSLTSGSLLSASSAKKWFDKTSQVLESKLEAVLQGPSGPAYRPAYATNAPPRHHPGGSQQRGMPPQGSCGCAPGPGPWGQGPPPGRRGP